MVNIYMNRFCLFLVSLAASWTIHAMPSQVLVIRHGEKPKDRTAKHLSEAGRERADRLVEYVKNNPEVKTIGSPAVLVAALPTKDGGGQRTSETLEPLAKDLKLGIETPFQSEHSEKLAQLLLSGKEYDGKIVLVCWTHERIPELIDALGVHPAPAKMADDSYDPVYVISYGPNGACMKTLRQDMPSAAEAKESKVLHFGKKKAKL